MVYALDSTSIRICLELSPWAEFHHGEGCVKMHTLIDLRGSIPSYIVMTNGLVHDSKVMPMIPVEEQAFYLMDKGYIFFKQLLSAFISSMHILLPEQKTTCCTMSLGNMK